MRRHVAFVTLSDKQTNNRTNERTVRDELRASTDLSQAYRIMRRAPNDQQRLHAVRCRCLGRRRRRSRCPAIPEQAQHRQRERGQRECGVTREQLVLLLLFQLCSNAVMPSCSFAAGIGLAALLFLCTVPFSLCSLLPFWQPNESKVHSSTAGRRRICNEAPKWSAFYCCCTLALLPSLFAFTLGPESPLGC